MIDLIKTQLGKCLDRVLVERLLESYLELKMNFCLGKHRPSELEGGRFAEVTMRILQLVTTGSFTSLSRSLPRFDGLVQTLESLPAAKFHDSIRLHIPRILYAIYQIRNRRDVGHVGGDVSPNIPDSTLIMNACTWVLTELIRLYHTSSMEEAQSLVDKLLQRRIPIVYEIDGFLKVMNPRLSLRDKILTILYVRSPDKTTDDQLSLWLEYKNKTYLRGILESLRKEALIHRIGDSSILIPRGQILVEKSIEFETQI